MVNYSFVAPAELAAFVEPMLAVTFAPTMIGAGSKINVIPSQAWLKVDCRVPPGLGEVFGLIAPVQNPAQYGWMQRFNPPAENSRVAREVFNRRYGQAKLLDKRLGAAGRIKLYVLFVQQSDNGFETVFVKNGDQG